jgi:phosphohistidine swiveling domain-containing protein
VKKIITGAVLAVFSLLAHALQPYVAGDKLAAADLKAVATAAEQKLVAGGFTVIGRHMPPGMPAHASIIVTDRGLTAALAQIGGSAVVGIPIRVGVKADGSVSYLNLEYWLRAYLRGNYGKAEAAVNATSGRLQQALGAGKPFGGEVAPEKLPTYRYMAGMERFDDKSELKAHANFDEAVKTIRDNLAKAVAKTSKVYEVVIAEKKIAVFGVATNDAEDGEGWWAKKIGADHIAALPWEIFVVDNRAYALFARYRTALAWPDLGMFQFMGIGSHPDSNQAMMAKVAGGVYEGKTGN